MFESTKIRQVAGLDLVEHGVDVSGGEPMLGGRPHCVDLALGFEQGPVAPHLAQRLAHPLTYGHSGRRRHQSQLLVFLIRQDYLKAQSPAMRSIRQQWAEHQPVSSPLAGKSTAGEAGGKGAGAANKERSRKGTCAPLRLSCPVTSRTRSLGPKPMPALVTNSQFEAIGIHGGLRGTGVSVAP